jgi:hypothetical protein
MTATPHNGKEEDFQLFMALLMAVGSRGKFRDGVHAADTSDPVRRMVKENRARPIAHLSVLAVAVML